MWGKVGEGLLAAWCAFAFAWFLWRRLHHSRDPALLIFRWLLTIGIVALLMVAGRQARVAFQNSSPVAAMAVIYATFGGLFLAIIWVPVLADWVSNTLGSLYTGGNQEVEPKPFYSVFRAMRLKGKYFDALAEVRRQLDKFPNDFEGHMLLAELQAENLNDLPGAEVTIHRCCNLPEQSPGHISFALNKLADWHLGLTKDREAAQCALEKMIELLPGTEMALRASQRIGHLADTEMLLSPHNRERIEVKKGVRDLGLVKGNDGRLRLPETDVEKEAAEYVAQLEKHPLDTHAREKLADIYAKHYHRLDLAINELEQLIQQPNHAARKVVHWLNFLADLQVQEGADHETVRATLQRIIDLFPESAGAQTAQRRIDTLNLELRSRDKNRSVQLGEYEQDIGLKGRRLKG
jgi:TolA-binding protein